LRLAALPPEFGWSWFPGACDLVVTSMPIQGLSDKSVQSRPACRELQADADGGRYLASRPTRNLHEQDRQNADE
jgi:hypothetical protein